MLNISLVAWHHGGAGEREWKGWRNQFTSLSDYYNYSNKDFFFILAGGVIKYFALDALNTCTKPACAISGGENSLDLLKLFHYTLDESVVAEMSVIKKWREAVLFDRYTGFDLTDSEKIILSFSFIPEDLFKMTSWVQKHNKWYVSLRITAL